MLCNFAVALVGADAGSNPREIALTLTLGRSGFCQLAKERAYEAELEARRAELEAERRKLEEVRIHILPRESALMCAPLLAEG